MWRRVAPDALIQSPTSAAWVIVNGGSRSTASRLPVISVEVIGDHIRVLPSGSGPRPDCGSWPVTNVLWCSAGLICIPSCQLALSVGWDSITVLTARRASRWAGSARRLGPCAGFLAYGPSLLAVLVMMFLSR